LDLNAVRAELAANLSDAMMPKVFQRVTLFRLTANGKIDRKNLPPVEVTLAHQHHVAPRNNVEQTLVEIWQAVLNVEQLSVYDDFFALGGHSLLVTRVHNRLREHFLLDIPLRTLFEVTTIAQLAALIQPLLRADENHDATQNGADEEDFEEGVL
ncbi:MAG TPA: phosphopantetheine-binding protein, partial [Pseudomonadales bacterium]|nr:phosphopantetheine-binding protein [Pseudomonadales bacterium]